MHIKNRSKVIHEKKEVGPGACRWDEKYYVEAYRLARDGLSGSEIPEALGVRKVRWARWLAARPTLKWAVELGSVKKQEAGTQAAAYSDFVTGRMPPDVRRAWERLVEADGSAGFESRVESLLEGRGRKFRQQLWLQAVAYNNFDAHQAARMTGVGPAEVRAWKESDPDFGRVFEALAEAKQDMVEGALMSLVVARDSPAVIFANKTLNRGRGYDTKVTVRVEGEVEKQLSQQAGLEEVLNELSVEAQAEVLTALRKVNGRAAPPPLQIN